MKKNRNLGKWVGIVATLVVVCVALTPNTFHIPIIMRPWIFIGSLVWVVTVTSGVFNP